MSLWRPYKVVLRWLKFYQGGGVQQTQKLETLQKSDNQLQLFFAIVLKSFVVAGCENELLQCKSGTCGPDGKCQCSDGWIGERCDILRATDDPTIDICATNNPCKNGFQCRVVNKELTCRHPEKLFQILQKMGMYDTYGKGLYFH